MKQIAILGSTGSIGTQTLDVVRQHPNEFSVYALSAHRNVTLLIQQAIEFNPAVVCIADETFYQPLRDALSDLPIKVMAGEKAIAEMVTMPAIDVVVAAMVGYAGLRPTMAAIKAKKTIALANKETLVVAGEIICRLALRHKVSILPVDSEHSAIFQCLMGNAHPDQIKKLILTCSGGPFFGKTTEELKHVTKADALKHPNWAMGAKITIDSATLMNKGLEFIEAMRLYDVSPDQIQVVIHRKSIVHSLVEFTDGAVMAQLGTPDMRLPIQLALTYPERMPCPAGALDLVACGELSFLNPDLEAFPCLALAMNCARRGGNACAAMNGANEEAVALFLQDRIGFYDIYDLVSRAVEAVPFVEEPTLEQILNTDARARAAVRQFLK